jgi:hypothetical protein
LVGTEKLQLSVGLDELFQESPPEQSREHANG